MLEQNLVDYLTHLTAPGVLSEGNLGLLHVCEQTFLMMAVSGDDVYGESLTALSIWVSQSLLSAIMSFVHLGIPVIVISDNQTLMVLIIFWNMLKFSVIQCHRYIWLPVLLHK